MKSMKCEIYLYVPDAITERDIAKTLAESQHGHELASKLTEELKIADDSRIQFAGMVY